MDESPEPEVAMDSRELFERMIDSWNAHDADAFVAAFADDCEVTSPVLAGKGHEVVRQFWELYDGAFPDYQVVAHRVVVEGNTVVEESTFRGTHTKPLRTTDGSEDIPPTGARIEVPYAAVYTVSGDKFVGCRMYWDQMAIMGQLGLLPE
jgi:predicted ester cyclase